MRELTDEELREIEEILTEVEEYNYTFSHWESNFLMDIKEKHDRYGDGLLLSDKQLDLLRAIYDKMLGATP